MSVLLQIQDICKSYGANDLLKDACASFSSNQKIGVIGRNGAGKSTLCRIITGEEEADSGSIIRNSELKLSYLEQHDSFRLEETVLEYLMRYTGREEWECAEVAGRFQLKNEKLTDPIGKLAGGYRTRVKLTAMLLGDPNFLILDEPTNYLDLATLILLENFLQNFNGGFLIVSHDREFLKRTCDHTLEVDNGDLTLYPGDVEEYFEFKEMQVSQVTAYNKNVEKKREQLKLFVDRFRAKASTASRAQAKMRQLEKLKTIEIQHHTDTVRIRIPQIEKKAGTALTCSDLAIGYPEKLVADKIDFDVERGARIAVLGDNGQGKTTFLRTLAGDLPPKAGSFKWGTGLKIAYYAQHVFQTLHPEDDIFSHLKREAPDGVSHQNILDMAGSFLFKGDDVKKKVSVLSGGERARLCLAGLLLSKSHVLLLDEPTNHLDFETVEALGSALSKFDGAVFFICHDRTFVNLVATQILEVKDGSIMRYPGKYEDYVYYLESQARAEYAHDDGDESMWDEEPNGGETSGSGSENAGGDKLLNTSAMASDFQMRKQIKKEIKDLEAKIGKIDNRLRHYTDERDRIMDEMKKNPFHFSRQRNERMKELAVLIEGEESEWTRSQEKLEMLRSKI